MRIIIRAVPSRLSMVEYLKKHLPQAEVLMDNNDPALDGKVKCMLTFKRALAAAGRGACLHMEDDAVLTRDFAAKAEVAIAARPDRVIQFFSMRKDDATVGSRWDRSFMMTQCFYLPPLYSAAIVAHAPDWQARHPEHPGGIDLLVADWLKRRKEAYWIHCPSLVDHRVAKSAASPGRSSKRQSKTFADPVD